MAAVWPQPRRLSHVPRTMHPSNTAIQYRRLLRAIPFQKYAYPIDSRNHWERVNFTSLDFRRACRSATVRLSYDLSSASFNPGSYLTVVRVDATVNTNVMEGPIKTATSNDLRRRLLMDLSPEQLIFRRQRKTIISSREFQKTNSFDFWTR